jgi:Icc protein
METVAIAAYISHLQTRTTVMPERVRSARLRQGRVTVWTFGMVRWPGGRIGHDAIVLMAQLSDTHLLHDPNGWRWGHNPAENLASVVENLPPVDVVVVTGDIADDGSVDAYRLADAITAATSAPRYFIAGNHDDQDAMRAVFGELDDVRVVELAERWSLILLNSQWVGHEGGYVPDRVLDRLARDLDRLDRDAVLCLHHPPLSPCPEPDCGLRDSDRLLEVLRGGPVRVVLSGHVHQDFEVVHDGITFLGAPSTLGQLRHGGDPHFTDTDEPPAAQVVELHDNGRAASRVVIASDTTTPSDRAGSP